MSDRSDRPRREHDPRRDLTTEEEKFFRADRDPNRDPDPERHLDRPAEPGGGHRDPDAFEAGAAAPARAPEAGTRERQESYGDRPGDDRSPEGRGGGVEAGERASPEGSGRTNALFRTEEADSLRARWDGIQTEFVDQPRAAVEKADALVGDVMQRLADGFSSERARLERDWDRGDSVSTEDLRVALKRYRSFFDRLLSI